MIRGGGDPNTAMALKPCPEWARRLGASPQKRIVASWFGSRIDPTEYKVAARASRPSVGSPRINYTEPRTMKDIELQKHLTRKYRRRRSAPGRLCCKSRKSNCPEIPAKVDFWTFLPLQGPAVPLRRSVVVFV